MSYAVLAELPPVYGLYCALAGPLCYTLLGTSRHLSIGPVALVSLGLPRIYDQVGGMDALAGWLAGSLAGLVG